MTHWSLSVSDNVDQELREFLAKNGRMKKGDLSSFVENAVRDKISTLTIKNIKERNSVYNQEDIMQAVEQACKSNK